MSTSTLRADGTWAVSIPLPLWVWRVPCCCGRPFWTRRRYERHWQQAHA